VLVGEKLKYGWFAIVTCIGWYFYCKVSFLELEKGFSVGSLMERIVCLTLYHYVAESGKGSSFGEQNQRPLLCDVDIPREK